MKRNGKDVDERAILSLGRTSREGAQSNRDDTDPSESLCLSLLSRIGLSMLAGNAFGGGVRLNAQPSSSGLRFGPVQGNENAGASVPGFQGGVAELPLPLPLPRRLNADLVRRLTMHECWRLILELGMRWPVWKETTASHLHLEVKKENDGSTFAVADGDHHLQGGQPDAQHREQDLVTVLATRALDALAAQPPPRKVARAGMLAPKQTIQERLDVNVAPRDASQAPRIPTPQILPVFQHSTSSSKASPSSRDMPAPNPTLRRPQNAELTIFYDGIVNVCDNIPPEKARLIMMYAENAGLSAQTGPLPQKARFMSPSTGASSQATLAPNASLDSKSNKVALPAGPSSSVPGGLARSVTCVEGSASGEEPAKPVAPVAHGQSPEPVKVTFTTQPANPPRQVRQNVMLKPLPNARRNSLARFLDSRKRWTGAASEEEAPKKPETEEGGPSDAHDSKESETPSLPSNAAVDRAADQAASDPC